MSTITERMIMLTIALGIVGAGVLLVSIYDHFTGREILPIFLLMVIVGLLISIIITIDDMT